MKRNLVLVAVALMMALMMAVSGVALAQGGDVCVSNKGQTKDQRGTSTCSSDSISRALAVNESSATAVNNSQATAINNSVATASANSQATASAGTYSEATAVNDSTAIALGNCTARNGETAKCP